MSHPGEAMAEMPRGKLLFYFGLQAAVFAFLGLALWMFVGNDASQFVTIDLHQTMLGLGIGTGMIALGYALMRGFPKMSEKLVRDQVQQFAFLKRPLGLGGIVFVSACAGIGEEALFRGGLLTLLDQYTPIAIALFVSSAAFTIIHLAKPFIASLIFAIGLFVGLVYWASGSLLAVMIAHWLYDIWAIWFLQKEMQRLGVFDDALEPISASQAEETKS